MVTKHAVVEQMLVPVTRPSYADGSRGVQMNVHMEGRRANARSMCIGWPCSIIPADAKLDNLSAWAPAESQAMMGGRIGKASAGGENATE
jgi:hypothetical protein